MSLIFLFLFFNHAVRTESCLEISCNLSSEDRVSPIRTDTVISTKPPQHKTGNTHVGDILVWSSHCSVCPALYRLFKIKRQRDNWLNVRKFISNYFFFLIVVSVWEMLKLLRYQHHKGTNVQQTKIFFAWDNLSWGEYIKSLYIAVIGKLKQPKIHMK